MHYCKQMICEADQERKKKKNHVEWQKIWMYEREEWSEI